MFLPHMALINITMITLLRPYEQNLKKGDAHQSSAEPATISANAYLIYVVYKHNLKDKK